MATLASAVGEEGADFGQVLGAHHGIGDQAIDRRVGGAAQAIDGPTEDALGGQEATEVADQDRIGGPHFAYSGSGRGSARGTSNR